MWSSHPMRRRDRLLSQEEATTLLEGGEYGVLASAGAEGIPLATPLSYVLLDGALYFHCAMKGQKLDNIAAQPRVCFCVVGPARAYIDDVGDYTTLFQSAVAHGSAHPVEDEAEKRRALLALCEKYVPGQPGMAAAAVEKSGKVTRVIRIDIDELTGKAKKG